MGSRCNGLHASALGRNCSLRSKSSLEDQTYRIFDLIPNTNHPLSDYGTSNASSGQWKWQYAVGWKSCSSEKLLLVWYVGARCLFVVTVCCCWRVLVLF
jgi:hypothetical protein